MEPGQLLTELSQDVVQVVNTKLAEEDAGEIVAVRKRDITLGMDDAAETTLERGLASRKLCARIVSEERGDRIVGDGEPGFTLVFDPVDGSANAIRGLDLWVTSIAYSPDTGDIHYPDFTHAAVRDRWGGLYFASRGGGASYRGEGIHSPGERFPGKPIFSVYLSGSEKLPPRIGSLLKKAKLRVLGSIALDICNVAAGHFDGAADLRDLISAWDVMAASLILEEAGGVITDDGGKPVEWGAGETDISFIAARDREMHSMLFSNL